MDYMHEGAFPSVVEDEIKKLKIGEITQPMRILEGVAIFRLIDRKPAIHHPFERVRERAGALYDRERRDKAWEDYKVKLRAQAALSINTDRYPVFAEKPSAETKAPK